eukprot:gene14923-20072_t
MDIEENQEDRIAWLRDRGVEVDLAEERKTNSKNNKKTSTTDDSKAIKIIKIPCDDRLPYEEISIPISKSDVNKDQLIELLRVYFRGQVSVESVQEAASKQFSSNSDIKISSSTVDTLAQQGSTELFPLSYPSISNKFRRVAFYLDEAGQLKKLPFNARASAIAEQCGFKSVPMVGDMFLGRVHIQSGSSENPTTYHHEDFLLSEVDSNAEWLKNIVAENYERGVKNNRVSMALDDEDSQQTEQQLSERVKWSETNEFVEVIVCLPKEIPAVKSKDLKVQISSRNLHVILNSAVGELILIDKSSATLQGIVRPDESTWSLINGNQIEISLEKVSSGKWGKLFI